jgi:uncharacterized membrane protein YjdF
MNQKQEFKIIIFFLLLFLVLSTAYAALVKNTEFLLSLGLIMILIITLAVYHKKLQLSNHILIALSILIILHVAGGNLYFSGVRLYDIQFFNFIRYDNIMHSFGAFIFTLLAYNSIRPNLNKSIKKKPWHLAILLILITLGLGAVNEILELFAVLFFNAAGGVGDYLNNAWDLVFNTIGAFIGIIIAIRYHLS